MSDDEFEDEPELDEDDLDEEDLEEDLLDDDDDDVLDEEFADDDLDLEGDAPAAVTDDEQEETAEARERLAVSPGLPIGAECTLLVLTSHSQDDRTLTRRAQSAWHISTGPPNSEERCNWAT